MKTRALGGSIPGPTLKLFPGEKLKIFFKNCLKKQATRNEKLSEFRLPDTSNLHTHGLHTSPLSPGDNVIVTVEPGKEFDYVFEVPKDHLPGTFWIHTHFHGAATI